MNQEDFSIRNRHFKRKPTMRPEGPQSLSGGFFIWERRKEGMDTLIQILWAVLPSIVTGIVLAAWNRKQKKRDDAADQREADRQRGEIVQLDLLVASAELTRATAVAVKYGHANGEIDVALGGYNKAIEAFREFEREQLV